MKSIAIIGAGFTGAVLAYKLANNGFDIDVFESRDHVAGNCHTERDEQTGVMLHKYGPHIFHTNNQIVWDFVNQFDNFKPYVNRVKAFTGERIYSLPINLLTINQFFNKTMNPKQARNFIESLASDTRETPRTFEEQALRFVGEDIYKAFFKEYTKKQWGVHPDQLPASILKRLPLRFNYDDNYFNHPYQGIPEHGYTHIVSKLLDHANITVHLNTEFSPSSKDQYQHTFYSGQIDAWFGKSEGSLGYRTLDFEVIRDDGDYQGCAVMNYCDDSVAWTRISEHKHFAPWETHEKTICYKEYSRACENNDIPYYPIRLADEKTLLEKYVTLANELTGVTFLGRLGTYRYLDMDVTIAEALEAAETYLECKKSSQEMSTFLVNPLA